MLPDVRFSCWLYAVEKNPLTISHDMAVIQVFIVSCILMIKKLLRQKFCEKALLNEVFEISTLMLLFTFAEAEALDTLVAAALLVPGLVTLVENAVSSGERSMLKVDAIPSDWCFLLRIELDLQSM